MANYQSIFTGPQIDERLRKAGVAVLTEEQSLDAEEQAQARDNIDAASSSALADKVDKVQGKGLSTNDYTDTDKSRVDALPVAIEGLQQAIAAKYTKPANGIPASDLASGVIPDVSAFITKSVNDLTNYYLKSETYTQAEVQALIGAIQQFHYEIYASTSAVTNPQSNVLYLIGPTGSGADRYEEYVYSGGWVKIGDTSIDLSGYVTTSALNTALAAYTTSADLTTLLAGKQDVIDATHKLPYSLISDTPTIPAAVEANPTVPSGTTPTDLAGLKVGNSYYGLSNKEDKSNKVTSLSAQSTDTQYPSAKCVYDLIGDVETLINAL